MSALLSLMASGQYGITLRRRYTLLCPVVARAVYQDNGSTKPIISHVRHIEMHFGIHNPLWDSRAHSSIPENFGNRQATYTRNGGTQTKRIERLEHNIVEGCQ